MKYWKLVKNLNQPWYLEKVSLGKLESGPEWSSSGWTLMSLWERGQRPRDTHAPCLSMCNVSCFCLQEGHHRHSSLAVNQNLELTKPLVFITHLVFAIISLATPIDSIPQVSGSTSPRLSPLLFLHRISMMMLFSSVKKHLVSISSRPDTFLTWDAEGSRLR